MRITHAETVTRDTQKTDVIYVGQDDHPWYTPDGIGRIWLFVDPDEQTVPMTLEQAMDEVYAEEICYLDQDPDD